jgi:hypothetical protein
MNIYATHHPHIHRDALPSFILNLYFVKRQKIDEWKRVVFYTMTKFLANSSTRK